MLNNQFEFHCLIRKRVQQLFVRECSHGGVQYQSRVWSSLSCTRDAATQIFIARLRSFFFNCLMSHTYLWMSRFAWDPIHSVTKCEDAPKIWTWNSKSNDGHHNIKWDFRLYKIDAPGILDHPAQSCLYNFHKNHWCIFQIFLNLSIIRGWFFHTWYLSVISHLHLYEV